MKQNKIHNHKSLIAEKQRLKASVALNKLKIVNEVEYFQSNYKSIIWEKINPFKGKSAISQIANMLINEVLPTVIDTRRQASENNSERSDIAFDLLKTGIGLLKKISKKKLKKKDEEV